MADFRRDRWPDCVGISSRLASDYAYQGRSRTRAVSATLTNSDDTSFTNGRLESSKRTLDINAAAGQKCDACRWRWRGWTVCRSLGVEANEQLACERIQKPLLLSGREQAGAGEGLVKAGARQKSVLYGDQLQDGRRPIDNCAWTSPGELPHDAK